MRQVKLKNLKESYRDSSGFAHTAGRMLGFTGNERIFETSVPDQVLILFTDSNGEIIGNDVEIKKCSEWLNLLRILPIPGTSPFAVPVASLLDGAGYVATSPGKLAPLSSLIPKGGALPREIPAWLSGVPFDQASLLAEYASTGSLKKRLGIMAALASQLASLHACGLSFGKLSSSDVFISKDTGAPWIPELSSLHYARPGSKGVKAFNDESAAFAAMAFEILTLAHPFIGMMALESVNGTGLLSSGALMLRQRASSGGLPFVDEPHGHNGSNYGLPRKLALTPALSAMFLNALSSKNRQGRIIPPLSMWAFDLSRAYDQCAACPECGMSYYPLESGAKCPYCGGKPECAIRLCADASGSDAPLWFFAAAPVAEARVWVPQRALGFFSENGGGSSALAIILHSDGEIGLEKSPGCKLKIMVEAPDLGRVELFSKAAVHKGRFILECSDGSGLRRSECFVGKEAWD